MQRRSPSPGGCLLTGVNPRLTPMSVTRSHPRGSRQTVGDITHTVYRNHVLLAGRIMALRQSNCTAPSADSCQQLAARQETTWSLSLTSAKHWLIPSDWPSTPAGSCQQRVYPCKEGARASPLGGHLIPFAESCQERVHLLVAQHLECAVAIVTNHAHLNVSCLQVLRQHMLHMQGQGEIVVGAG